MSIENLQNREGIGGSKERVDALLLFREKVNEYYKKAGLEATNLVADLADLLRKDNLQKIPYAYFHMLSGSSEWKHPEMTPELDRGDGLFEKFAENPQAVLERIRQEKNNSKEDAA